MWRTRTNALDRLSLHALDIDWCALDYKVSGALQNFVLLIQCGLGLYKITLKQTHPRGPGGGRETNSIFG